MAKRAVCVGINDYPGTYNDLAGCVNDASDWADLLSSQFDFKDSVTTLLDGQATREGILGALSDLVDNAKKGDILAFTYSGHGTWVPDQGELDESDNRDEAICARDGNILDDELRGVLLTGCNAYEYSYDAYINGRQNGAMTSLAIQTIKNDTGQSYRDLHETLRSMLPSTRYPQSPQLEGPDEEKDRGLFS